MQTWLVSWTSQRTLPYRQRLRLVPMRSTTVMKIEYRPTDRPHEPRAFVWRNFMHPSTRHNISSVLSLAVPMVHGNAQWLTRPCVISLVCCTVVTTFPFSSQIDPSNAKPFAFVGLPLRLVDCTRFAIVCLHLHAADDDSFQGQPTTRRTTHGSLAEV